MSGLSAAQRLALSEKLRGLRQRIAEAATEAFYERHPNWLERFGERGRAFCIEDGCFHMDFLAGAVDAGSAAPFADYARWTMRVLSTRGIEPVHVVEHFEDIGQALLPLLPEAEQEFVGYLVRVACTAARADPAPAAGLAGDDRLTLTRSLFLQAILQGQRQVACTIATEAVRAGHAVVSMYTEVLQESLYEVGRRWEGNQITVATEHMATAIVQFALAQLYPLLPMPPHSGRGNIVITGVEGELHQVGANMVADFLEANGWNVRFLGTNMPHAGILQAVEEHRADVVGISTTMLFNLPKVRRLIADVRVRLPERTPRILIGGGAFRSLSSPQAEVGADGYGENLAATLALLAG